MIRTNAKGSDSLTDSKLTDQTDQPAGKRFGCLLYSLSFFAVLMLAIGLPYFVWYSNARSELDGEIERIKSRGEPLFFSDLAENEPDPERDGTPLFLLAISKIQAPAQAFYDRIQAEPPAPPGDYPELVSALASNGPALDLLRQAVVKPSFRLPIDYHTKQPFMIGLQPIQDARELARLLQAAVLQSLGAGDNDRAVAAVQECLALSHMLRDEPFIITQLVRYAIAALALQSLETVVARVDLTPEQFLALDEQLDRMGRSADIRPSIIAERCASFTTMVYLDENRGPLTTGTNNDDEAARIVRLYSVPGLPYLTEDQAYMLRTLSELADAVDKPAAESSGEISEIMQRLSQDRSRGHALTRLLVPAVLPYRGAAWRFRQRLLNARLGVRIARFRSEHGELPRTLADILDDRLATAVDVYSRQPLVYETSPDSFLLYPAADSLDVVDSGVQKPEDTRKLNTFKGQFKNQSAPPPSDSSKPDTESQNR